MPSIKMNMLSSVVQTTETQASRVSSQSLPRLLTPPRQVISVQNTGSFHKNTSEVCEDLLSFAAPSERFISRASSAPLTTTHRNHHPALQRTSSTRTSLSVASHIPTPPKTAIKPLTVEARQPYHHATATMAAQMPEVVPTAAPQVAPLDTQKKPLEPHKNKCIGLWKCCTCGEEYNDISDLAWTGEKPYTTRDHANTGDLVCSKCINREFTKALGTVFDHNFPARWGGEELNINDFRSLFFWEHDFRTRYEEHRVKYERNLKALDDATLDAMVPEGLVRGVDFQRCNGCKTAIGLRDGCNHMTCTKCAHNFCCICGKDAGEDSGNWSPGGCPRWGRPGEQNAMFDDAVTDYDFEWSTEMSFDAWT
jgi:hypothetical protein